MDATPAVALPEDAPSGIPDRTPAPTGIGPRTFHWGSRTFVMGILNVTPDSFSGDGLLEPHETAARARDRTVATAVERGRQMVADGADLLDVGGESSRPGHATVPEEEERERVVPVIRALREAMPTVPLSVDTTKAPVAAAALEAGADMVNDVWGVGSSDALPRLAAERGVPLVVMHNRSEARYRNVVAEVIADLQRALDRALALGVPWDGLIVDPGIGFGKTVEHNLVVLAELEALKILGRPVLLGTSRKSTIGRVLDLPADERLEGTLATTALAVAAGVELVRVHDVRANLRAARMADAIVRRAATAAGSG